MSNIDVNIEPSLLSRIIAGLAGLEHRNVGATLVVVLLADAVRRRGDHKGRPLQPAMLDPSRIAEAIN
jgi:hypothetical protein